MLGSDCWRAPDKAHSRRRPPSLRALREGRMSQHPGRERLLSFSSLSVAFQPSPRLGSTLPRGGWRLTSATLLATIVTAIILAPLGRATTTANHPVSIVEADVYVNRGQTTVRLTCFAEDLELLQGVEPLDNGNYDSAEILEATQDHAKYLAEKIRFLDENGDPFPVRVTGITDVDIPAEGIEAGTLMNFTMGFEFELDYESPPEFMTIQQDMVAEGQLLPSELKVLLKQAGSKTPYRKMLKPGIPETFRFDWDNPPISPEASKEEWDNWFEEQRQDTLGIASYSSVYSFIYINDHEVRHEILIPLANLTTMMDFERADQGFLSVEEQAEAAKQIELFFSVGNPVKIDGVEVQPIFDRIDFYGLDLRDFANRAAKRKVSMASGRVGIIMRYPAKGRPIDVEVTWDKFNDSMRSIESVAFPYKEIEKVSFSMFLDRNVFHWKAGDTPELPPVTNVDLNDPRYRAQPVTVPIPVGTAVGLGLALVALLFSLFHRLRSVALGAAAVLTVAGYLLALGPTMDIQSPFEKPGSLDVQDSTADAIFLQLHRNLFRSFDYSDESAIYDALARSVDGDLLRKLYLQINDSLRISEQGGAVSRIENVEILSGQQENEPFVENGFPYRCRWNIVGTIEHWGHIHERTNQYDAQFEIQIVDGSWKIVEMEVLDQPQGIVKTRLRKF